MKIVALPKTLSQEEALKIARKRGNILGRLIVGQKEVTLKLMYLESKEIVYDMTFQTSPLLGMIFPSARTPRRQKIRILVEGTRCNPAYVGEELQTVTVDVADEDSVQDSTFPLEKMIDDGKYLAKRMVRRQVGRHVSLEPESIRSVYRPFYVAFYGALQPGTKVRYLPIPADGNQISRVL